MKQIFKTFILCLGLFIPFYSSAQTTNISGVINAYASVTSIISAACLTTINVNSTSGFNVGDSVMIIQMKGAIIDSLSTTSSFGSIQSIQSVGKYEVFKIASIAGNSISFFGSLSNVYNINGRVQLVSIPVYNNAVVTGTLSCLPWNGQIGGVLAFFVTNSLTLNANIDVTGNGFKGGNISNNPDGSCGGSSMDYYYDLFQPGGFWINGGAMKGEGVAELSNFKMAGKGHLANGGGGGNKHNCGGGGGGNYTYGGKGGNELEGCVINSNGGLGGETIPYLASGYQLLVMGGGGGCGDYNNNVGSDGTNGGGIIMMKANSITGNNNQILSNGADNLVLATGISDGAGGGGAGGAILIECQNYIGNLSIKANGGHGGDQGPGSFYGCAGPGGGGGTGLIMVSAPILPVNVISELLPGTSGMIQNPIHTCFNTPYGATDGMSTSLVYIPNASIQYYLPAAPSIGVQLGNDTVLCSQQNILLSAVGPFVSYSWQDLSTNSTYLATSPGTYYVTAIDASGCVSSDTIKITVIGASVQLGKDTSLCKDDIYNLSVPSIIGATFLWQDNSTSNTFTVTQAGTYWVEMTINNCKASDTIQIDYLDPPPIFIGNDTSICLGEKLILNATTPNASYLWQDNSEQPTLLINSPGQYWVEINVNNCVNRDTILVGLIDSGCNCNLFIPNAFSPNNDFKNDEFSLVNTDGIQLEYFAIYNRWGQLVFETNSVTDKWNGFYKNKEAEIGSYYYQIKYRCRVTKVEYFSKGDITLIR